MKASLRFGVQLWFTMVLLATGALAPASAQQNDTRTLWLDGMDLSAMSQGWGEPQINRSMRKQPLSIAGVKYERGVGTHATSHYELNLQGGCANFKAFVGLDDSAGSPGSVVFRVIADGKKVFDSGIMSPGTPAKEVSVDLRGVQRLALEVGEAQDGYQCDHADWAQARFEVTGPVPVPVDEASGDPTAGLTFRGKSNHRLARPVELPFRKVLPGPITDWALMTVDGKGHREYYLRFEKIGLDGYEYLQRRGRASNVMKPMWVLSNRKTGQGLALMLAYMGNWTFSVTPAGEGKVQVRLATSPGTLPPFMEIRGMPVPGALVSEFQGHWDYGTQPIVRFTREKLLRDLGPDWPPVQYNTWYDIYDKLSQERLLEAAKVARGAGCELFTIDAGWFGEGLGAGWSQTLGDWRVNKERLPGGLEAVSDAVHGMGMKFGLWFEIECAAPSSRLAKEHPDWFLTDPQGKLLSKRAMLDFGKPEVLAHAKEVLDSAVRDYGLDYIKMDFNTDPAIENDHLNASNDPLYKHYQGMANLWMHLRKTHPGLIVEDCSSGARRHELTSAALTDTHWISDTIDNQPNLLIMLGATYFFPASTCSHWTTRPDAKDSVVDLDAQFVVNMMGHLGLSGSIHSWDAQTLNIAKDRVAQYKLLRPLIRTADVFHLTTPSLGSLQAASYVDKPTGKALLFAFQAGDSNLAHTIRFKGLQERKSYTLAVPVGPSCGVSEQGKATGKVLMEQGLRVAFPHKGAAVLVELMPAK